jgi:heptosyltransferase-2
MQRILIVSVNWLGDAIMLTPACKALKKLPGAYVAVMAHPRVADVFKDSPFVDEVITFDERGREQSISAKLAFIKTLKEKKFDTVFLVQRSFTRALLCMASGIPRRIGYTRTKTFFVVNQPIEPNPHIIHRQDFYLYLFEKTGVVVGDRIPEVFVSEQSRSRMKHFFSQITPGKFIVGINPSANWVQKRWPYDRFAKLCDCLIKDLECAVVFIGARADKETVDKVIQNMEQKAFNLCGNTSVKELAASMQFMSLFISNDSGPAHLSAAMGTNTLVLFGPTSSQVTGPRGKHVSIVAVPPGACTIPCYKDTCSDPRCMNAITVEEVFSYAKRFLNA